MLNVCYVLVLAVLNFLKGVTLFVVHKYLKTYKWIQFLFLQEQALPDTKSRRFIKKETFLRLLLMKQ